MIKPFPTAGSTNSIAASIDVASEQRLHSVRPGMRLALVGAGGPRNRLSEVALVQLGANPNSQLSALKSKSAFASYPFVAAFCILKQHGSARGVSKDLGFPDVQYSPGLSRPHLSEQNLRIDKWSVCRG
jgi:hypothetical protein